MKKFSRSALTTQQTVIIVAVVVIVAGGGYWWYTSRAPPPSWEYPTSFLRYSRFGLSFEYPEGMVLTPGNLLGGFDH
ncbi:hypothetical protein E3J39_01810, partial [Candidatus Bathyarchaeota archaeon]